MCGSEAFAPLGTAAFEHELAALRAHANAEAMSLGAPAVVRLKSPLHGLHVSLIVSAEKGKAIGSTVPLSRLPKVRHKIPGGENSERTASRFAACVSRV